MKKTLFLALVLPLFLAGCVLFTNTNQPVKPTIPANTPEVNVPTVTGAILNLSNQNLTKLPSYVLGRTDLATLDISHNALTGALPAEIRQLKNLKILNASYNNMTGVPAEIGQLSNLEELDLSHNQLTGLPYELGNLQKLKLLRLTGNNYSQQDLDKIKQSLPTTTTIGL
ncbi:MAG: leucine-rich repeat domain-containing protein [Candidatus Komeilibacteria bacterium]